MDTILDCGHLPSPHSEYTTGYGQDSDGKTWCWDCCARIDRENMETTGKITLYLSPNPDHPIPWKVTNWPGTLTFPVHSFRVGRHNIAYRRYDVWFTVNGHTWHGVQYGDNTQIAHCRRVKG